MAIPGNGFIGISMTGNQKSVISRRYPATIFVFVFIRVHSRFSSNHFKPRMNANFIEFVFTGFLK